MRDRFESCLCVVGLELSEARVRVVSAMLSPAHDCLARLKPKVPVVRPALEYGFVIPQSNRLFHFSLSSHRVAAAHGSIGWPHYSGFEVRLPG